MKNLMNHLFKYFQKCPCTNLTPYPHIHVVSCNDCGSIEYVGTGMRYLPWTYQHSQPNTLLTLYLQPSITTTHIISLLNESTRYQNVASWSKHLEKHQPSDYTRSVKPWAYMYEYVLIRCYPWAMDNKFSPAENTHPLLGAPLSSKLQRLQGRPPCNPRIL